MTRQERREREAETTRGDGMSKVEETGTARQAPDVGMPGGRAGVDTESVDFDDMGDLDRGADDATDAEPSTGPGPGYGMSGGPGRVASHQPELSGAGNTGSEVRQADLSSPGESAGTEAWGADYAADDLSGARTDSGAGRGTAPAMRMADITGGMGSDTGDEDGIGAGTDMDLSGSRGDIAGTGTPQRAGLGGPSSGTDMDTDPAAGASMANPADMGDQG